MSLPLTPVRLTIRNKPYGKHKQDTNVICHNHEQIWFQKVKLAERRFAINAGAGQPQ
ncbi:hypothetical protein J1C56_19675 [Aminobacter anthyllidis]|jgi:hypothetical protein|uniref:Uncharacterized protein n=1 Tax=Aminobacter anthyllidis TaxID=1035067 RepID=A0A9X1D7K9_9HYPH|nr:hypothetical protein [Aminobacter anthyllidis]MBT1157818.1 hypothetical protein [Aminobacter anthyllidis]